jgi:beta-glucosidase
MNQDQAIRNGGDFMLTMYVPPVYDKTPQDLTSATAKIAIRNAAHNILYATVNSNAMNGAAAGVRFVPVTPLWWTLLMIGDAVIACLIVLGVVLIRKRVRASKG